MSISLYALALLFAATLLGETIGSLVGGGSFLIQPALLSIGLGIHQAIALDVTASCATAVTGLTTLRAAGRLLPLPQLLPLAAASAMGSLLGFWVLTHASSQWLLGGFAAAAVLTIALSWLPAKVREANDPSSVKLILSAFFLGLYTSANGAGSGLLAVVLLTRAGLTTLSAMAVREFIYIPATIVAAVGYAAKGMTPLLYLLPMIVACALAGWLGSHLALKAGDKTMARFFQAISLPFAVLVAWHALRAT